jgi:hypothetical protein
MPAARVVSAVLERLEDDPLMVIAEERSIPWTVTVAPLIVLDMDVVREDSNAAPDTCPLTAKESVIGC